ncbi:MAG: hypothetical protein OEW30_17965, partial [Acidimicrobiia bacterium]|nr:hypothetical protein [Acidimicrobiia bacterium]
AFSLLFNRIILSTGFFVSSNANKAEGKEKAEADSAACCSHWRRVVGIWCNFVKDTKKMQVANRQSPVASRQSTAWISGYVT